MPTNGQSSVNDLFVHGLQCLTNGEFDKAIADFSAVIRLEPQHVEAHIRRCAAYADAGDLDMAIVDGTQAIRLSPLNPEAYCMRAAARQKRGDVKGGVKDYGEAIRLNADYA